MSKTKKPDDAMSDTAHETPPQPVDPLIDVSENIAASNDAAKQTIEHWQIVLGTPQWLWAGMKLGRGWPIGKEVTLDEYEAAVHWAASVTCR